MEQIVITGRVTGRCAKDNSMKRLRNFTILSATVIFSTVWGMIGCAGRPELEITDGRLPPCPNSPNCVSSQADDQGHKVDPIPWEGSFDMARERLVAVVRAMPRARITNQESRRIDAVFISRWLRFRDDVLFWFDEEQKVIHVRSASRVGYSDLGANRKRVAEIRRRFQEKAETQADEG